MSGIENEAKKGVKREDVVIKIVDKSTDEMECYGIILTRGEEVLAYPVYPFVSKRGDKVALVEFIEEYREKLTEFYLTGKRLDFANYILPFRTEEKQRFRDAWHSRGVLIY